MPNWCSNYLTTDSERVDEVMRKLVYRQKESGEGESLDWLKDDRYLFDIYDTGGAWYFDTKWGPATKTAETLSKVFGCEVTLDYDEPGSMIRGKLVCNKGVCTEINLTNEDFDLYHYDDEKDCYIFEGEAWDNDSEIKDELLERKIRLYDQQSLHSGDSASQD
jgi:hypothetical protein